MAKCLLWAMKYQRFIVDDWRKTGLFTDESKFKYYVSNRRAYGRRRMGRRCFKPTVKRGGGNIQVWGFSVSAGVGTPARN